MKDDSVWPPDDPAIFESLQRAWQNGDWGRYQSDISEQFAHAIAQRWKTTHVRLCGSGTMAVELALRGVGVRDGDEVVLAAYDYPGNLRCVELLHAKPVLVDIDRQTLSIDPASLQAIQRPTVKAVLVSHLYGQLADVRSIREICDQRGWALIEDACQVPGAGWIQPDGNFTPVGTDADVTTLSFGGSKPLTAGTGGAVLTNSGSIAARMRTYAQRPSDALAMSPLQAAVLLPQLESLDLRNQQRSAIANRFARRDWSLWNFEVIASCRTDVRSAYYKLAIRAIAPIHRSDFAERLNRFGITTGQGYRGSHRMNDRRVVRPVSLSQCESFAEQVFLIDHRYLTERLLDIDWNL